MSIGATPTQPTDHHLEEWTECRGTVGRMDNTLADIRKYGFSLVTILLTASALITTASPIADRVAASTVVIVLVLVLFLMDRYWWVMLRWAVVRAIELEKGLGMRLSGELSGIAKTSHNNGAASLVYAIFVLVAGGVALVSVVPSGPVVAWAVMLAVTGAGLLAIAGLHFWFQGRMPHDFKSKRAQARSAAKG